MRHFTFLMAALIALLTAAGALRAEGPLVIVGGGLSDDNDAVFAAFLDALPAPDAPIAIIPAASGVPVQSARAFAEQLTRRGVAPERIRIIRLATQDDPATPEDEGTWRSNGENAGEVMRFAGVGGIWFTGGDQARIVETLIRSGGGADGGDDTAMLSIIRTRHAAGAVIGGTSAGAAIMSRVMIRQGDPLALVPGATGTADPLREPIVTGQGLGFLPAGLVDQHFGERARLIRLVGALRALAPDDRIGIGIDEDTALVIAPGPRSARGTGRVIGRGQVTVVDARAAAFLPGDALDLRRAAVMVHTDGAMIDLLAPAPQAAPNARRSGPAPCIAAPSHGARALSQSAFVAAIAADLAPGAQTICLIAAGTQGLSLRFYRGAEDTPLMLDIAPMTARIELNQR